MTASNYSSINSSEGRIDKQNCKNIYMGLLVESSVIVIFSLTFLMRYVVIINYFEFFFFKLRENRE